MGGKFFSATYSEEKKGIKTISINCGHFNKAREIFDEKYLFFGNSFGEELDEEEWVSYRHVGDKRNIFISLRYNGNVIIATSENKKNLRDFLIDELSLPEPILN